MLHYGTDMNALHFLGQKVKAVFKLSGLEGGLNPLTHLNDPPALVNFNPLGGGGVGATPLAHIIHCQ